MFGKSDSLRRSLKYRAQCFYNFIHSALVVEVDGDIHDQQQEEDERREKVLSALGPRIVRFRNDEVMKSLSAVVGKISKLIGKQKSDS